MGKIKRKSGAGGKKIRVSEAESINFDSCKPCFSLEYLQKDYCLTRCNQEEKAAFADALHKRSQFTWNQLKSQRRHALGYEIIERHSLRVTVPDHISEDVAIIAFRFKGKAPMVGYRKEATFFLLWLDRNFTVYPH